MRIDNHRDGDDTVISLRVNDEELSALAEILTMNVGRVYPRPEADMRLDLSIAVREIQLGFR